MNQVSNKIRELIEYLNYHTKCYDSGHPEISDMEWDASYFKLAQLEKEYSIYFNDSPTQSISYEVVNSLEKVVHNHDMLSLEKTKALEEVKDFLGNVPYLAMCKMDGLTCSLKYYDGYLVSAETRGNGKVGENILHNARVIPSIPKYIPYKGLLVIDGEIICTKDDFKEFENEYANPRNFASGSIRLLDSNECSKRKLRFVAWDVIEGLADSDFLTDKFVTLSEFGFTIVPYYAYNDCEEEINKLTLEAEKLHYPIDGIVFKFDDVEYGRSLGQTSHHFKNALAFKFVDDTYQTSLLDIEWTMGRTGVLTPVAVFEPIDVDGSTVERASLHNVSILNETLHGWGYKSQKVEVFKANMIIPQIASAEEPEDMPQYEYPWFKRPSCCPICGGEVHFNKMNDSMFLVCTNPNCEGKLINRLDHFCGKKGLDIKGLSKATLEKLIDWNWVSNYTDLFELKNHRAEWIKMPGFGIKSVDKILEAIEASRKCELSAFIAALGIPLVGTTASKDLAKHFCSWNNFIEAVDSNYHFWDLPNFGYETHSSISTFDYSEAKNLVEQYLDIKAVESEMANSSLSNLTFVITGKVNHFKNRDEIKALIESKGGKVAGSVSSKTNYLINNDTTSNSSKNVSAKKLGIEIISEDTFIEMFGIS